MSIQANESTMQEIFNRFYDNGTNLEEFKKKIQSKGKRFDLSYEAASKIEISKDDIKLLNIPLKILILGAPWCGDSLSGIPVTVCLIQKFSNWTYSITNKDEVEEDFAKYYKTGKKQKIPIVIFATPEGEEIIRWIEKSLQLSKSRWVLNKESSSKEEFDKKMKASHEFKPEVEAQEIIKELVNVAKKAVYII